MRFHSGVIAAADQAIATSAEILANGRTLIVYFEQTNRTQFGVPDWLAGKIAGATCALSNGVQLSFRGCAILSNVPAFRGGTYTNSTKALVKAGAFANYRWTSGDQIGVLSATGSGLTTEVPYTIASKDSNDQITLATAIGGNATDVRCNPMPAGQGTKLIYRAEFLIVDAASVVTYDAAGLTFRADAGLIQDVFGNTTAPASAVPVTNYSQVDADGFTTDAGFARGANGVTLYVAPGFGSDSNTFVQAQSTATPYATVAKAMDVLHDYENVTSPKGPTGSCVRILQGTSHAGTIKVRSSGTGRLTPCLIESYWDGGLSGVGTQGVRPIITASGINPSLEFGGGSGIPLMMNYVVVRGLNLIGIGGDGTVKQFRCSHFTLDDCLVSNSLQGMSVQFDVADTTTVHMDRNTLNRCTFFDCYPGTTTGHSMGLYARGVKNFLLSQCHFDYTGRQNSDGAGTDAFSRSVYIDSENEPATVWGCYVSRSDGIQNRPGGTITDCAITEAPLVGFTGGLGGGRMARIYAEYGSGFGTTAFTGATYTHSTRTLALSGIGTGLNARAVFYITAGTGTVVGQYRVASASANAVVFTGSGLGAGADGSANVAGVKFDQPRGFGPQSGSGSDTDKAGPQLIELCLMNRLSTFGGDARAVEILGKSSLFPRVRHVIARNHTGRLSLAFRLAGTDVLQPPIRVDKTQNIIDEQGVSEDVVTDQTNFADWSYLRADYNQYRTSKASPFSAGTGTNFAGYQTKTSQESHSVSSNVAISYVADGADLGTWAGSCGLTATLAALRTAVRGRTLNTWPSWADMSACVDFMFGRYAVSGLGTVGTSPLNFYGCGTTDPAVYG